MEVFVADVQVRFRFGRYLHSRRKRLSSAYPGLGSFGFPAYTGTHAGQHEKESIHCPTDPEGAAACVLVEADYSMKKVKAEEGLKIT